VEQADQAATASPPPSLPLGALMLAVIGLLGGASGIVFGVPALFGSESTSFDELLAAIEREAPAHYRQQARFIRQDPALVASFDEVLTAARDVIPAPRLLEALNLGLSLWCVVAGVGMLRRREWGRRAEIALIVVATLLTFGYGYLCIPGLLRVCEVMERSFRADVFSADVGRNLYLGWTVMAVIFGLLHAGIVWYLTRPRVRAVFDAQAPTERPA